LFCNADDDRRLMNAIVYRTYGSPNVLHVEETATPTATDDQVLIWKSSR
jgi:hypothetical protein